MILNKCGEGKNQIGGQRGGALVSAPSQFPKHYHSNLFLGLDTHTPSAAITFQGKRAKNHIPSGSFHCSSVEEYYFAGRRPRVHIPAFQNRAISVWTRLT